MSRLCRLGQGSVSDVRADDPVDIQSVQVGHRSDEALQVEAIHGGRRQLCQLAGGSQHVEGMRHLLTLPYPSVVVAGRPSAVKIT